MSRVRGILLHVCVVCSFVCITAKILDWYNPYMNFTGHIWGIQMVLYLAVIILGAIFYQMIISLLILFRMKILRNILRKCN